MKIELTEVETRVLGSLIEKSRTTPDYYPLSLGALVSACNQKSSRDPVMQLGETEVLAALDGLVGRHLVSEKTPSGSRVTKYSHRLDNTLGLNYDFDAAEVAVLCLLMLRGPQTVGELRNRSGRLHEFASLEAVEQTLVRLVEREEGPVVTRLARRAGHKEARYAHLLSGEPPAEVMVVEERVASPHAEAGSPLEQRVAALEADVADLKAELERLRDTGEH